MKDGKAEYMGNFLSVGEGTLRLQAWNFLVGGLDHEDEARGFKTDNFDCFIHFKRLADMVAFFDKHLSSFK